VKLQNSKDVVLKIRADVLEQSLELQDLEGDRLSCLRFGPVFFGTSRVEKVVLVNNGPQACDWMVVLQDDAPGTEMVRTHRDKTQTHTCTSTHREKTQTHT
jgi:hypothetical protein